VGPDDNPDGDLSLEKIKKIAEEVAKSVEAQAKTNLTHLCSVIKDGLGKAKANRSDLRPLPQWFIDHPGLGIHGEDAAGLVLQHQRCALHRRPHIAGSSESS
jgi:hypothetical protein